MKNNAGHFCARLVVLSALMVLCFTSTNRKAVKAQTQTPVSKERVFDRLALALTGRVVAADPQLHALKEDLIVGRKQSGEIVEALVKTDGFLTVAAQFWLTKMKITGITDFETTRNSQGNRTVMAAMTPSNRSTNTRTLEWVTRPSLSGGGYFRLTADFDNTLQSLGGNGDTLAIRDDLVRRTKFKQQYECRITEGSFVRTGNLACPTEIARFSASTTPNATAAQLATCKIAATSEASIKENTVNPWFAPSKTTHVCPGITDLCGSNLEKCFPAAEIAGNINAETGPVNRLVPNLRSDFTYEPGIIAASVIRDDRPWEDVLRATDTPITGTMEHFLASQWGSIILQNMPPGSYSTNGELILSSSRSVEDRTWDRRERGSTHAGVLTTLAFQKAFNGWRAKAAGSMEAFLCRIFEVPEGVAVLPSAEVDLTRKPYCQSCHSVLEPLSLFFGRWPNLGNTNYLYDAGFDRVATGSFENISNADTNGLARVYTSTKDFHDCGVHRAFELIVGRHMNAEELVAMFPRLQRVYSEGGNKILPVLKEIAAGPLFLRSRQ